ncbi:hypothetical protein ACQP2F_37285 [Actinoplanes sp. CA-030573]|uniref:hypothetical protein n=1 Tax=Actinoplanes sp. CA-030573 TaxID=3239898 RepID=UPI003D8BE309
MASPAVPEWLVAWCRKHLGSVPSDVLLVSEHMSEVYGLRLADGREVAVKARPDQSGREATCVEVQRFLALNGYPAAAPVTGVTVTGGRAIHAEEWRPGGELSRDDSPAAAVRYATGLARLVGLAAGVEVGGSAPGAVEPPLPNPEWTRWDHDEPGPWPRNPHHDGRDESLVPAYVVDAARRVRERLAGTWLPRVLGHADWESQNIRWDGDRLHAVHDWDSLAWLPEAAIAGAASGAFGSYAEPTLTPVESSAAFLDAYQKERRGFSDEEIEVAWAASLWLALHNARGEALHRQPPVALIAVREQVDERLRLAGA